MKIKMTNELHSIFAPSMSGKTYYEPEVYYCSYCGKNIWSVVNPLTHPEQLICSDCSEEKRKEKEKND